MLRWLFKMKKLIACRAQRVSCLRQVQPRLCEFFSAPLACFRPRKRLIIYICFANSVDICAKWAQQENVLKTLAVGVKSSRSELIVLFACLSVQRANTMDEVLQGIRIIKYFAWEKSFVTKVQEVRLRFSLLAQLRFPDTCILTAEDMIVLSFISARQCDILLAKAVAHVQLCLRIVDCLTLLRR